MARVTPEIFNSNFYIVAALVIPIFFLGLMFPDGILFNYWREIEKWHNKVSATKSRNSFIRLLEHAVYGVSILPALYLLAAGGIAETISILVLDYRHATPLEHALVLAFFVPIPVVAALCVMILVILRSMEEN
jgi:hypothetical protein